MKSSDPRLQAIMNVAEASARDVARRLPQSMRHEFIRRSLAPLKARIAAISMGIPEERG